MKTLAFVAILLTVVACSTDTERCSDVNQDRIFQSLTAGYDDATKETTVGAQFRFGDATGTTLEMVDGCSITHDTISMTKDALSDVFGTSYSGRASGRTVNHTFVFTNMNGTTYTNSGTLPNIEFETIPVPAISRAAGATIHFSNGAIAADESVTLYISGEATSPSRTTETALYSYSTNTAGADTITIPANDLSRFINGEKSIYLSRSKRVSLTQATGAGGRITTTQQTAKQAVTLTD